jgi:hypothetical protein
VACTSCSRPLCAECWAFDVDGAAWCRHCVEHIHDRSPAALPLAFLGASGTLLGALYVRFRQVEGAGLGALAVAATLLVTTVFFYRRSKQVFGSHRMAERPFTKGRPHHEALGAYRSAPRTARLGTLVPPVSGRLSALVLLLCLLLPLAVVPGLLNVPAWLAVDAVLGLWWLTLTGTFAVLLYRGARVADDGPRLSDARPEAGGKGKAGGKGSGTSPSFDGCGDGCGVFEGLGSVSAEGCGGLGAAVVVVVVIAGLVLVSWLLAEFVLPLLFTAAYFLVSRGLRRVANDTHECQGDLPRALGWSVAWATLYTLPFALIVVLAQGLVAASR